MNSDAVARLREALDHTPDTSGSIVWNPNVGDELIGVVVTRDKVTSKFTENQPHLVIEDHAGDRWHVYARHTILTSLIDKHNPQPGDRIGIRRLPDVPGKNYRVYKMVVEPIDIPF